jgi:Fe-S cluster assembly iron-binding protein IscA
MLTVTPAALAALKEHLDERNIHSAIRIAMLHGSCSGENLRFILGELQPNDLTFSFDGLTFLVAQELSARCGNITVDFAKEHDHCPCSGRNGGFSINGEHFSFHCGSAGSCDSCSGDCATCSAEACAEEE